MTRTRAWLLLIILLSPILIFLIYDMRYMLRAMSLNMLATPYVCPSFFPHDIFPALPRHAAALSFSLYEVFHIWR